MPGTGPSSTAYCLTIVASYRVPCAAVTLWVCHEGQMSPRMVTT